MDITPETSNLYWHHQTITALWKLNQGWEEGTEKKTQFTVINIMLIVCISHTHWSRNHCFVPGIQCQTWGIVHSVHTVTVPAVLQQAGNELRTDFHGQVSNSFLLLLKPSHCSFWCQCKARILIMFHGQIFPSVPPRQLQLYLRETIVKGNTKVWNNRSGCE